MAPGGTGVDPAPMLSLPRLSGSCSSAVDDGDEGDGVAVSDEGVGALEAGDFGSVDGDEEVVRGDWGPGGARGLEALEEVGNGQLGVVELEFVLVEEGSEISEEADSDQGGVRRCFGFRGRVR